MNMQRLQRASIYNLTGMKKGKKKALKKARVIMQQTSNLIKARRLLNLPRATLDGVYLNIIRGKGITPRKSDKAKHNAIKKWLQNSNKGFYETAAWRRLRYEALKLHGRQCMVCGAKPPDVVLHVDHIIPRSKRPDLELDIKNLQIMCGDCNLGKGNSDSVDYR